MSIAEDRFSGHAKVRSFGTTMDRFLGVREGRSFGLEYRFFRMLKDRFLFFGTYSDQSLGISQILKYSVAYFRILNLLLGIGNQPLPMRAARGIKAALS